MALYLGSNNVYLLNPFSTTSIADKDIMSPSDLPDYVRTEVVRVAEEARKYITTDSIVFLAMSDGHYYGAEGQSGDGLNTNTGNIHAAMAIKSLVYLLPVDFITHLGDICCGAGTTAPAMLKSQIEDYVQYFHEARADLPVFLTIGNHDPGIYYHQSKADGQKYTLSGDYLYDVFTSKSDSADTVFGDKENGGYCYRDFTDKKLRVFMLNTSENIVKNQTDMATLGSQRIWFANALLDLNNKVDAASWSWLLLSHYPADYGNTMPLSELLKAYVDGGSITITDENGTSVTANFSGKNKAKMIAQFHGHVHNFKVSKLHSYATGNAKEYDAWRICIPTAQYNRENYYTFLSAYPDINFSEEISYPKTPNTAEDTSFVVNVINPTKQVIYSICYGAGYDRAIGYGTTAYYSITSKLSNVSLDNDVMFTEEGSGYTVALMSKVDYDLTEVTVTMDGVDITTTAYNDGVITITEVTGDIVITAKATALNPTYTNLVTKAVDANGDSAPYTDDVYLGSDGTSLSAQSGLTTTGFIPIDGASDHVYRIGGEGISWSTYGCRIAWYDSNFTLKSSIYKYDSIGTSEYYPTKVEDGTVAAAFKTTSTVSGANGASYFRLTAAGKGENLIVTVDEPIE